MPTWALDFLQFGFSFLKKKGQIQLVILRGGIRKGSDQTKFFLQMSLLGSKASQLMQSVFTWEMHVNPECVCLSYQPQQLQQQQQQPFYVSRYQKKHTPTHHPDHHAIFISFFHLPRSIASSLFKLRAWQSFLHNLFPCPLWSTSWSGALHLIFHTFLHLIRVFFLQHMPYQPQVMLENANASQKRNITLEISGHFYIQDVLLVTTVSKC